MAKQVQLRRGTTAELSSVTGAAGEVIVDTTKDTLTVHDAYTAGGTPLLREDLGNLADQSIAINKIVKGSAGQVLLTNAAGTGLEWGNGASIAYVHHFEDATRNIAVSNSANGAPISFTINKQYANSYLIVKGRTPNSNQSSYHAGCYVEINGSRKYEAAHFMAPPASAGDDNQYGVIFWDGIWTDQTTAGTKTITLGWSSRDGTLQQPSSYWNPDQRSARIRSRTTVIDIFEVLPALMTSFT